MTMTDSTKRPLFVVGPLRSGTTFLRLIVGMHPQICIFGEFEESVHELPDAGWPSAESYRNYLSTHRAFAAKGLSIDPSKPTYLDQVQDLWNQLAAKTERPIMGASIHSRFDRCPDIWPTARYIHLLRDPRDVARSCIGMGWVGNVYFGADYWLEAEHRWDALRPKLSPEQWYEIRYEDLVTNPVEELTKLCSFLDVPYDPVLLDYPKHTTYGPPDAKLAQQWKKKLSEREVEQVEYKTRVLMQERGYELSTPAHAPSATELARLTFENRFKRAAYGIDRYGLPLWLKGRLTKLAPQSGFSRAVKRRINDIDRLHLR